MARPRSVSKEDSLELALQLFWERGYDLTSIADLSAAIGVGPSSLYNSFGSKENLFRLAIERYLSTHAAPTLGRLDDKDAGTAVEYARGLLREAAKLYTSKGFPRGCAMFEGAGSGPPEQSPACAMTHAIKRDLNKTIRKRLDAYSRSGEMLSASSKVLAAFLLGSMRGLSQLACDGANRTELMGVADHAAQSLTGP